RAKRAFAPTVHSPRTGSVVDMNRRVGEGGIPGVLVGPHQIAALVGHQEGTRSVGHPRGECHATLPRAVRLDGPVALIDNPDSAVQAAGVGRRRVGDQPCADQHGSQYSADAVLHGCLLAWHVPPTVRPLSNDATAIYDMWCPMGTEA